MKVDYIPTTSKLQMSLLLNELPIRTQIMLCHNLMYALGVYDALARAADSKKDPIDSIIARFNALDDSTS